MTVFHTFTQLSRQQETHRGRLQPSTRRLRHPQNVTVCRFKRNVSQRQDSCQNGHHVHLLLQTRGCESSRKGLVWGITWSSYWQEWACVSDGFSFKQLHCSLAYSILLFHDIMKSALRSSWYYLLFKSHHVHGITHFRIFRTPVLHHVFLPEPAV